MSKLLDELGYKGGPGSGRKPGGGKEHTFSQDKNRIRDAYKPEKPLQPQDNPVNKQNYDPAGDAHYASMQDDEYSRPTPDEVKQLDKEHLAKEGLRPATNNESGWYYHTPHTRSLWVTDLPDREVK